MGLTVAALQTLGFVVIVFGNQATTYANRERRHLWSSRPSVWLLIASVADLLIASTLAVGGFAMTPLPAWVVAGTLVAAAAFAIILSRCQFSDVSGSPRSRPVGERNNDGRRCSL
jgi:H+-transporting ATPase